MAKNIDRREFFKSSMLKTGAGLIALNELFDPALLAGGVNFVSATGPYKTSSFCLIDPDTANYRTPTDWFLNYTAGDHGLPKDWALMIRCMSPIEFQHQLTVDSTDPEFKFKVSVKKNVGIKRVIWIEPDRTNLTAGQSITIRLKKYPLPKTTARCAFAMCEVNPNGSEPEIGSGLTFYEIPTYGGESIPFATKHFQMTLPTRAQTNQPIEIKIAAFDEYWMATPGYTGTVEVVTNFPIRYLPDKITFTPEDKGCKVITCEPLMEGIIRILIKDEATTAESNPCVCTNYPVVDNIFWGEYHKHSFHCDGHLEPDELYEYGEKYGQLDWAMVTPHDTWPAPKKGARNWPVIHAATEAAHKPGKFVTFHGYEWTHNDPFSPNDARGHKIVFFLNPDHLLPLIPYCYDPDQTNAEFMPPTTLLNWLKDRAGDDVIVIPHHLPLYKWWIFPEVPWGDMGGPLPAMSRAEIDKMQPVAEVFSKIHGMNESWGLKEWIKKATQFFGLPLLHTYWLDALKAGVRAGAICAGDNHYRPMGHPAHTALAGVLASELTREAIFRAIQKRRTYGTSGPRVFIHFIINNARMGDIVKVQGPWIKPNLEAAIISPVPIDYVEVVRVMPGDDQVVHIHEGQNMKNCFITWQDSNLIPDQWVCYYLRIHMDGNTQGAWTSPIWFELDPESPHLTTEGL
ncbi:MAG: DUF3604 domain-containing protein [Planctomycetota bacterium]|jgi:hypothetical protein